MKKFLFLCMLPLLCSCMLDPIPMRTVEVKIGESHPWESGGAMPMWHTLCWSDGDGGICKQHLPAGTRSASIRVPRDKTTYICAYPLGELHPYGGASSPGRSSPVVLDQGQGFLCDLLLSLSRTEWDATACVDYPAVLQMLAARGEDLALLDYRRFARDLVNGSLDDDSVRFLEPVPVFADNVPPGYWVGEQHADGGFWAFYGSDGVGLLLSDGLHRFLDREDRLSLHIFVDIYERTTFSSVRRAPLW